MMALLWCFGAISSMTRHATKQLRSNKSLVVLDINRISRSVCTKQGKLLTTTNRWLKLNQEAIVLRESRRDVNKLLWKFTRGFKGSKCSPVASESMPADDFEPTGPITGEHSSCCLPHHKHLQDHYPADPSPELKRQIELHRRTTIEYNKAQNSQNVRDTSFMSREVSSSRISQDNSRDRSQDSLGSPGSDDTVASQQEPEAAMPSQPDDEGVEDENENEEKRHERMHKAKLKHSHITNLPRISPNYHQQQEPANGSENQNEDLNHNNHHHRHHHHHHHHDHPHHHHRIPHHHHDKGGHIKELIKPDHPDRPSNNPNQAPSDSKSTTASTTTTTGVAQQQGAESSSTRLNIATAVDEEQLHQRLVSSRSSKSSNLSQKSTKSAGSPRRDTHRANNKPTGSIKSLPDSNHNNNNYNNINNNNNQNKTLKSKSFTDSSHSSTARSHSDEHEAKKSPPPVAIIIPPNVVESLSSRRSSSTKEAVRALGSPSRDVDAPTSPITKEQLEYGPMLKTGEVQVLYRSQELPGLDRQLKDEHAKRVAPNNFQSPIGLSTSAVNYQAVSAPLLVDYPASIENLRLNNTGQFWDIKIPYQISVNTSISGGNLPDKSHYKLDQFHCHWGTQDGHGSEHCVDDHYYSAELHFVHYNLEKYRNMSMAARQPDGLVVVGVFLDAQPDHPNHAELDKIVSHIKAVPLKGEHIFIKQPVRVDSLLPANKSYWSYHGSLTTPPYFESVTWYLMKTPIKCKTSQLQKFRALKSSLRHESGGQIVENRRKLQPLNGRQVLSYDEPSTTTTKSS